MSIMARRHPCLFCGHDPREQARLNILLMHDRAKITEEKLREVARRHVKDAVAPIGSREHENMDVITMQNLVRQEEIIYYAMVEALRNGV